MTEEAAVLEPWLEAREVAEELGEGVFEALQAAVASQIGRLSAIFGIRIDDGNDMVVTIV